MKTIFCSISKAVFIHVGVGAAFLVGCTNNPTDLPELDAQTRSYIRKLSPAEYSRSREDSGLVPRKEIPMPR